MDKFLLVVVHLVYSLISLFRNLVAKLTRTPSSSGLFRRVPHHLALLLVPDTNATYSANTDALVQCLLLAVSWCQSFSIRELTVYDPKGILLANSHIIRDALSPKDGSLYFPPTKKQYPITPPDSDYTESRPHTPDWGITELPSCLTMVIHRQNPSLSSSLKAEGASHSALTLRIASPMSSKTHIASVATAIAREHICFPHKCSPPVSVSTLTSVLEGPTGMPAPDLLFVHSLEHQPQRPMELHGFPPWQIRLTELFYNHRPRENLSHLGKMRPSRSPLLHESDFRKALDSYASAEMRFGK